MCQRIDWACSGGFVIHIAVCLLAASAGAESTLVRTSEVTTLETRFWDEWNDQTLALTDHDLREVLWAADETVRWRSLLDLPAIPLGFETYADSAIVRFDGTNDLLVYPFGSGVEVQAVADNWYLPNTAIAGTPHRIYVDPAFYLVVYTAPGPGSLIGLLDFADWGIGTVEAWALMGASTILMTSDDVVVVDLRNPFVPLVGCRVGPPTEGLQATGIAASGGRLYVQWGGIVCCYDVSTPNQATLLGQVECPGERLASGGSRVVAWSPGDLELRGIDATDPAAMVVGPGLALSDALPDRIQMHGHAAVLDAAAGLRIVVVEDGGVLVPDGYAWPFLLGDALAIRGGGIWLERAARRLSMASSGSLGPVADAVVGSAFRSEAVGSVLYTATGDAGLRIEDVEEALGPVLLTILETGASLRGFDLAGDRMITIRCDGVTAYELTDPASPNPGGDLPLVGEPVCGALVGSTALIATIRTVASDLLSVVDLTDIAGPTPLTTMPLMFEEAIDWRALAAVARGSAVHVLCRQGPDQSGEVRSLRVDLADPDAPQLQWSDPDPVFWCWADGQPVTDDLPVTVVGYHVAYNGSDVTVYEFAAGDGAITPLTTWTAPGPVAEIAASGNQLVVLTHAHLDVLTLSDDAVISAPPTRPALAARAMPNPFNPHTEVELTMPVSGPAALDVFDPRGRRIRRIEAVLPSGSARFVWDGSDDRGRPMPSGTYLLRVSTPVGRTTVRGTLVR